MGEKISDQSFEDNLMQGLIDDYEFMNMTSFNSPNSSIDDIEAMIRNVYTDRLSRPGDVSKTTGRATAVATISAPRKVRCYNCQEFGHIKCDCTNTTQDRFTTSKWCPPHNSMTHNDAECKALKGKEDTNTPPQGEVTNTPP